MSIKKSEDIHTPEGKRAFIYQYMAGMRKKILDDVPKMPFYMDSYEMRAYIAEKFEDDRCNSSREANFKEQTTS